MKYDVDVIVTPQYTDIKLLADNTERTKTLTQAHIYLHRDMIKIDSSDFNIILGWLILEINSQISIFLNGNIS